MDARKRPRYILSAVHTFCHYITDTVESGERVLVSQIKNQVLPLVNFLSNHLAGRIDKRETLDVDTLHAIEAALQTLSQAVWELRVQTSAATEDEEKVAVLRSLRVIRAALKMPAISQQLLAAVRGLYDALETSGCFSDAQSFADKFMNSVLGNKEDQQEDGNLLWQELKTAFRALLDNEPGMSKLVKQLDKAFEQRKKKSGGHVKLFFEKGVTEMKEYGELVEEVEWALLTHTAKPVGNAQAGFARAPVIEDGLLGKLRKGTLFDQPVAFVMLEKPVLMKKMTTKGRSDLFGYVVQERWANKFNHPAICKFYGTLVLDTNFYIAFESLENSLHVMLHGREVPYKSPTPMTTGTLKEFSRGIADGLNFLHSNQIIHRDLNPWNVYVTEQGDLKLAGFGLSGARSELPVNANTDVYLAPEVLRGKEWTFAADVYSYALICWEMTQNDTLPYANIHKDDFYKQVVDEGERPEFVDDEILLSWFEKMVIECWSPGPWLRPRAKSILAFLNNKTKGGKKRNQGASIRFMDKFSGSKQLPASVKRLSDASAVSTSRSVIMDTPKPKKRRSTMRQSLSRLPSMMRNSTQRAHHFLDAVDLQTDIKVGYKVVRYMELNLKDQEVQTRGCRAIKTFALSKGNEQPLMEMGAGIAVLNAMRTFPDSMEIAESGCGAICNLCFYERGSKALMQRGAMPIVINVLRKHIDEPEVLIEALQALVNLVHEDPKRKKAFLKFNAGELVVNIMRQHQNTHRIQEECCAAIVSLQDGFGEGGFFALKAHDLIITAIEEYRIIPSLQSMAFLALKALSVSPPGATVKEKKEALERKKYLVKIGVCEHVKVALDSFGDDEDVAEKCLALVATLAFNEQNIPHIMKIGFAVYIIEAMTAHPNDEQVQVRGVWAIANLVHNKRKWKSKIPKESRFERKEATRVVNEATRTFPNNQELSEKAKETLKMLKGY